MQDVKAQTEIVWCQRSGKYVERTAVSYTLNGRPAFAILPWKMAAEEAITWIERQRGRYHGAA